MASPIKEIVQATEIPASATVLYTSPAGIYTQIIKLTVTNTDGASHTVTTNLVPGGASAGTGNQITSQTLIAFQAWNSPNEEGHVLNPGDALVASADMAGVLNIFVSGILSS